MPFNNKICWILTEGLAGTEGQCLGVAAALGIEPVIKRIKLKSPWKQLSPWLPGCALTSDSDSIAPPYPDLLIASGRKSIGPALYIKKKSGGKTFLVQLQDPRINPKHFDLVTVPQHDPTRGDNVIVTTGALHRLTPEKLTAEQRKFEHQLATLPYPRVAVLIGGSSKSHQMTIESAKKLAAQLSGLEAGLMITASRRTGEENTRLLRDALTGSNVFFWDGMGDNPYLAFLGIADYIVVTEDSVSMVSEALSTGKPVYTAPLEGGAKRLDLFHKLMQEQGYTRPFTGSLETWSYEPLNDTIKVAEEIKRRLQERMKSCPKHITQKS
jgi:hypothetical protein